jgi:hypothetical protein
MKKIAVESVINGIVLWHCFGGKYRYSQNLQVLALQFLLPPVVPMQKTR